MIKSFALAFFVNLAVGAVIDRHSIVTRYNPQRNASSQLTPMQIGNGNFAFGADITGLQTFQPFAIMSSWGWKNDTLPPGKTMADVENYHGVSWLNHGRPVEYDFGGDAAIEQWLISNPNRVNLGRVGLVFRTSGGAVQNITEASLSEKHQVLDLWTGILRSSFSFGGATVTVETACAQDSDSVAIRLESSLIQTGKLGVFLDFPWNDGKAKFSAPFVGNWEAAANHTTSLDVRDDTEAQVTHILDSATFVTTIQGDTFSITRDSPAAHRYSVHPRQNVSSFSFVLSFGSPETANVPKSSFLEVTGESTQRWMDYWTEGGFVDVATGSSHPDAQELQRRIILSRYLMRVNEAGDAPPQESGLVNDGWYGKFHMEMYFWHSAHWALWNNWDIIRRSSSIYSRFLEGSIARAQTQQGWGSGARWPKMTDPSGRSSPGEINNLLIWQQPHPLIFAEYEYRAFPTLATLEKWEDVVKATADWMVAFAWKNSSSGHYDLGPPMFVVSEDTSPNVTQNPAFELAYWRLGLGIAEEWMRRSGKEVNSTWTEVKTKLAPLPTNNGTYMVYEGIESDFWDDPAYTSDHPALVGLHGWLPPTDGLDTAIAKATAEKVWTHWNGTDFWGWDFPMLAMSAARNGEQEQAINWLLDPLFQFDDVGMPIGGTRVPTPYFPGSGALLYAVAMMAAGWDGSGSGAAPGFPADGWNVRSEGLSKSL